MPEPSKVLFIGLDAAEYSLVEKWIANGVLPNMKRLHEHGLYARISTPYNHFVGLPWPMFYTGTNPGQYGAYHYLQWDPKTMTTKRLSQMDLPLNPFWRKFGESDPRTIVIDVPLTTTPTPFNGIEISGWATHEQLDPLNAYPKKTLTWINANIGSAPAFEERYGPLTTKQFLQIKDKLINMVRKVTRLAMAMMDKENWDLFIVVFSATHRGGHQLWDKTNVMNEISENEDGIIEKPLQNVYEACDQAIGELIDAAGEHTTAIVCSLHGMGINHSRSELLPEITAKILEHETENYSSQRPMLISRIREMLPSNWRHALKKRLPYKFQDVLTTYWRMGGSDWSNMPVISLVCDYDGYLQINLKGRELHGIVKPGEEYNAWIKIFDDGLKSFVDADSGEPIVKAILRREDLGIHGGCVELFPDMIIQWQEASASKHRMLISPKYGKIPWPTPAHNPEGRSGNHRKNGFMLALGERFCPNSDPVTLEIVDLAPTIMDLLGLSKLPEMEGEVIFK
jgi:predicted AlkP superfamily phosphohydrolase/phosphomutase